MKDHLDQPVNQVRVRVVEQLVFTQGAHSENMACNKDAVSQNGIAVFICNNIPREAVRAALKVSRLRPRDVDLRVPALHSSSCWSSSRLRRPPYQQPAKPPCL